MGVVQRKLTKTFTKFFDDQKSSGIVLIVCTTVSLAITNSLIGENYLALWHFYFACLSLEHWVNDGLMAIFFLLIGLELERELYNGELSNFKNALLPIFAAIGGVVLPALIHFALNNGTLTQPGIGIPMATDIAFALGVLALLGNRVPSSAVLPSSNFSTSRVISIISSRFDELTLRVSILSSLHFVLNISKLVNRQQDALH